MNSYEPFLSDTLTSDQMGSDFFKVAASSLPFGIAVFEVPGLELAYANSQLVQMLGYDAGHRSLLLDTIDGPNQRQLLTQLAPLQSGAQPSVQTVLKARHKNGEWRYLDIHFSVFRCDNDGAPLCYLAFAQDHTAKVLEMNRIRQLEHMVKQTEETFGFGKWEYDLATKTLHWSTGMYSLLGNEAPVGTSTAFHVQELGYLGESFLNELRAIRDKCLENGQTVVRELVLPLENGIEKCYRIEAKCLHDGEKEPIKIIGTTWSITEEYQNRKQLQKFTFQLRDAEKMLKFGTWEWDMLQNKVKWGAGFWEILEYPPEEHTDEWLPIERFYEHIEQQNETEARGLEQANRNSSNAEEDVMIGYLRLRTRLGNIRYLVSHTRILERNPDGKPSYAIGYSADQTDMKLIQNSLEKKINELNLSYEEVERFAYVASHDLQEPLRKVTSFGERLKTRCAAEFSDDCNLYLDRMMDATVRMRVLIENLLSLSRTKRNASWFAPTDLNTVLEAVLGDLDLKIQEGGVKVQLANLPIIEGIEVQIHQLFQNLLLNALKFSKKDGSNTINITANVLDQTETYHYDLDLFNEYVHIQIQDHGIGFEPVYAETIFHPFKKLHSRNEYEGTGIGLAICKKVIQNHKGMLWAEGELGIGATFHIILPIKQP